MHKTIDPAILYFGTPVVVISTRNEDGSDNLAPVSSIFWLGHRCVIGLGTSGKTASNLLVQKQCVLNLPSVKEVSMVDKLALTTGKNPVPDSKLERGYRFVKDKFAVSGFTRGIAAVVNASLVNECPVQLEAEVAAAHGLAEHDALVAGRLIAIELKIVKVHIHESLILDGYPNRVDPDKWKPLIMSFQQFYGTSGRLYPSALAGVSEELYRTNATVLE